MSRNFGGGAQVKRPLMSGSPPAWSPTRPGPSGSAGGGTGVGRSTSGSSAAAASATNKSATATMATTAGGFTFKTGDLVLVKWGDGMVYFAKIKRIDSKKRKCVVVFDDKSQDVADFSQIHSGT